MDNILEEAAQGIWVPRQKGFCMASYDEKNVSEIVDIKPKTENTPSRMVTAEGQVHEVDSTGDFIARLQTGNIVIDPTLAEKGIKNNAAPPLTIAEALERGDFAALNRLIAAQIARAQNGDLEGMREEDRIRLGLGKGDKELERERIKAREAELQQYFDKNGGYRDRQGGYYDAKKGTYTDKDGGTVDNYGGYTYPDGSYKSRFGDYYNARTNTVSLASGDTVNVPAGTSGAQVIRTLQQNVGAHGGYDANLTHDAQMQAADGDNTPPGQPRALGSAREAEVHGFATDAKARPQGEVGRAPPGGAMSGGSFLAALGGSAPAASAESSAPPPSRFQSGSSSAPVSPSTTADPATSSFFAVDSSISSSRFSAAAQDVTPTPPDTPDPATTTAVVRAKPVVPKSTGP